MGTSALVAASRTSSTAHNLTETSPPFLEYLQQIFVRLLRGYGAIIKPQPAAFKLQQAGVPKRYTAANWFSAV